MPDLLAATSGNGVSFIRKELSDVLPRYKKIRDVLENKVSEQGETYLPMPNAADKGVENLARYQAYQTRAVFYQVTSRTVNGLTGQVFANEPEVEIPAALSKMVDDANGAGVSLVQLAKQAVRSNLGYGRLGLYVDYPVMSGPTTKLQLDTGEVKPTINVYQPENIINWELTRRGAKHIYSLIVLVETVKRKIDAFASEYVTRYKVLRLKNPDQESLAEYVIELYDPNEQGVIPVVPSEVLYPRDSADKPLREIPFTFIGSENNDSNVDASPMLAMADLNIAHYRNSADYEEACFIVGQPTYVVAGLTQQWYEEILQKKLSVGSRGGIPLPVGATAEILQVAPNAMPKEAMEHKEAQMVALGAQLVEQKEVQQTAFETGIDNATDTSALSDIAKNVSSAIEVALKFAALFVGAEGEPIVYKLNTEFAIQKMSAPERTQLIAEWQAGAITYSEVRAKLRASGVATLDDEEAQAETAKETERKATEAADAQKKLTAVMPQPKTGAVSA